VAWTAAAALAFAASLFAKEAGLALPVAIAALVAVRESVTPRRRWWIAAVLAAVAVAYLPLRAALVATATAGPSAAALVGAPGALLEYARVAAVPFDLSIERLPHASYTASGWLALIIAVALCVLAWRRGGRARAGLAVAGLVWAAALLGPSLLALRTMNVVADRYAYTAMFGLGVAIAAAARELAHVRPQLAKLVAGVAALWAVALLAVGWRQVPVWRDADALYRHAVEMAPDSSRAHYRVAVLDASADRWDLAVPELELAIELDPHNVEALNNLGVYQLRTAPAAAVPTLQRAVAANPAHFRAWLNLGLAQLAVGQPATGCASIARALAIDPSYAAARAAQQRSCAREPR
jgi:tetratricopeptide (TPR) repeat protein